MLVFQVIFVHYCVVFLVTFHSFCTLYSVLCGAYGKLLLCACYFASLLLISFIEIGPVEHQFLFF